MDTGEYKVKISVRNNLILKAIEDAGFTSVAGFCKYMGLRSSVLLGLIKFSYTPINSLGEFTPIAKQLMEALGAAPTDLWTPEQLNLRLPKNHVERDVSQAVLHDLLGVGDSVLLAIENPEEVVIRKQLRTAIYKALQDMPPREVEVLTLRYGLDGGEFKSLDAVAELMDVGRARVQQLEARALRKMRLPSHSSKLHRYLDMEMD